MNPVQEKRAKRNLKRLRVLYWLSVIFAVTAWAFALIHNDYNAEWFRGFGLGACTMGILMVFFISRYEEICNDLHAQIYRMARLLDDIRKSGH